MAIVWLQVELEVSHAMSTTCEDDGVNACNRLVSSEGWMEEGLGTKWAPYI